VPARSDFDALQEMTLADLLAERDYQARQARADPAAAPVAALAARVAGDRQAEQAARDGAPFVAAPVSRARRPLRLRGRA
jgi:hypothetical protein